jgi:hypothetical protein
MMAKICVGKVKAFSENVWSFYMVQGHRFLLVALTLSFGFDLQQFRKCFRDG